MKKFVSILLSLLCVSEIFAFDGCSFLEDGPWMNYGDFYYCYINHAGDSRPRKSGKYIAVLELTEEGKTKETIIIPDEIEGKPVIQIGMTRLGYMYDLQGRYNNLYLPKSLLWPLGSYIYGDTKLFLMEFNDLSFLYELRRRFYLSEKLYNRVAEEYDLENPQNSFHIANMEFVSEDATYFIADYDEGELIGYIPADPVRAYFSFAGWYKEPECENAWNFEENTFSLANGQTIMKLYAKWL